MRTGGPVAKIELSAASVLEGYTQRRKTAQAVALRVRIVLGCAAGLSNKAAARERATAQTAGKRPALGRARRAALFHHPPHPAVGRSAARSQRAANAWSCGEPPSAMCVIPGR